MKSLGFKSLATLALVVASQAGAFAASTGTGTENGSLSTGSALGLTALLVAAILIPASKAARSVSIK
ncbi:hypothetical protein [Parasediminibacterium sp. JCM 36343]|uniref:hypothetical protein n=1 Tax=Parasediminibacterium sp. JCM 36343 TaxID=3374279 RepID=UPI00397B7BB9